MSKLLDWLDHRTGYRDFVHEALYESVPGGARWRYVWGSTLVFAFSVQLITGMFLWMCYSPSAQTAWESVFYIQHEMQGGWLLRGIHHYTAQAMVVLLALHFLQVVWDGAYKAPREINFWLGLILMKIVLGLSLTGYLLPWDQKGYWATQVATKIAGTVPVVGGWMQRLVVGGSEYGHLTLTRFFALHAGVLPALLVFFLVLHVALFRRHGLTAVGIGKRPATTFWPDQVLRDAVACLAVLVVVIGLTNYWGAELGAPADPANNYSAARPEWYFLFLFQFLKYFPGENEVYGAVVIPGAVMTLLFLMPFIGKVRVGHWLNVAIVLALLGGAGWLTYAAVTEDRADLAYRNAVWEAHQFAQVAEHRAKQGIPAVGAGRTLRDDTRAVALSVITRQCLSCHAYTDAADHGYRPAKPEAPNLYNFARKEWIAGLLDPEKIAGPNYFGATLLHGKNEEKGTDRQSDMVNYIQNDFKTLAGDKLQEKIHEVAAALAAEAGFADPADQAAIDAGRQLLMDEGAGCAQCHKFHDVGSLGAGPDLTGYGSREWIAGMIANPGDERFYGHVDAEYQKMPAFEGRLSKEVIDQIAAWLRGEWVDKPQPATGAQDATAADAVGDR
jgi:ubiquinol-cytochrome c reductase cytochrome b subunit